MYLNVITGLIEVTLIFGFSGSFYFIGTVLVEKGHFCEKNLLENYMISNSLDPNDTAVQSLKFIKTCPEIYSSTQFNRMSTVVLIGIITRGILGYHQGFIVDRFGKLFVRLFIHFFIHVLLLF